MREHGTNGLQIHVGLDVTELHFQLDNSQWDNLQKAFTIHLRTEISGKLDKICTESSMFSMRLV